MSEETRRATVRAAYAGRCGYCSVHESEAGAEAASAGFVSLNVVKQREGGPLLTKLGVVDTPAVLVVRRRDSSVFAKLHGFVDRQTVEQAVADARR